jgi:hypothetical protein
MTEYFCLFYMKLFSPSGCIKWVLKEIAGTSRLISRVGY